MVRMPLTTESDPNAEQPKLESKRKQSVEAAVPAVSETEAKSYHICRLALSNNINVAPLLTTNSLSGLK